MPSLRAYSPFPSSSISVEVRSSNGKTRTIEGKLGGLYKLAEASAARSHGSRSAFYITHQDDGYHYTWRDISHQTRLFDHHEGRVVR